MELLQAMFNLVLLFALGCLGWLLMSRVAVPNPAMLGALLFLGILRAVGIDLPQLPGLFSQITQTLLGFFVGTMTGRETLRQIRVFLPSAALTMVWALAFALAGGWLLSRFTSLDLLTAVLSASTGGLPEMTVLALETAANAPVVIFLQVFRVVSVLVVFPVLLRYVFQARSGTTDETSARPSHDRGKTVSKAPHNGGPAAARKKRPRLVNTAVSIAFAAAGSFTLNFLGVPAGAMLGAMLFVVLANVLGFGITLSSRHLLYFIQIAIGILASEGITPEIVQSIFSEGMLFTMVVLTTATFTSGIILAYCIQKITGWDRITCLLAAAPAGVTSMALLALDFSRDPVPISIIHISRVMALKTVIPLAVMFFL